MVVEIPAGTRNKVEYDPVYGVFRVDRVLHSPMHYPGDYGFIPGTLSPDGDALDALVLVTEATFTGCLLSSRPIGILEMLDEGRRDQKILAVPEADPRFDEVLSLDQLGRHLLLEVEFFFSVYKQLEGKETAIWGWEPVEAARAAIAEAARAFAEKHRPASAVPGQRP
ncbi:MAG: inorganic diphosphatase [Anaerolineae bacterium]|nr:inorganic diphosphatase [Anaerolineae bacterium]